jgi:hypothetical protein
LPALADDARHDDDEADHGEQQSDRIGAAKLPFGVGL